MPFRSREVRKHVAEMFGQAAPLPLGQIPHRIHAITLAQVQGDHEVSNCPVAGECELVGSCDGDVCLYNELFSGKETH